MAIRRIKGDRLYRAGDFVVYSVYQNRYMNRYINRGNYPPGSRIILIVNKTGDPDREYKGTGFTPYDNIHLFGHALILRRASIEEWEVQTLTDRLEGE